MYEDGSAISLKADSGIHQILIAEHPDRLFVPEYVGSKGWIGVYLH